MNYSIFVDSLKYINNNYRLVTSFSFFATSIISQLQFSDTKLIRSLETKDLEVIQYFTNVMACKKSIIDSYLYRYYLELESEYTSIQIFDLLLTECKLSYFKAIIFQSISDCHLELIIHMIDNCYIRRSQIAKILKSAIRRAQETIIEKVACYINDDREMSSLITLAMYNRYNANINKKSIVSCDTIYFLYKLLSHPEYYIEGESLISLAHCNFDYEMIEYLLQKDKDSVYCILKFLEPEYDGPTKEKLISILTKCGIYIGQN